MGSPAASASLLRPLTVAVRSKPLSSPSFSPLPRRPVTLKPARLVITHARSKQTSPSIQSKTSKEATKEVKEEKIEVEEELPWIQEKALDLVEFTGTVTQAIPGPRVAQSPMPWLLAVPLAYVGITFVLAFVKTVQKFTSPKAKRKRQVNKNAALLKSIDELFSKGREVVSHSSLKTLTRKTGFSMFEILRKYIRYTLNEKPFNPDLVVDLIHLRKESMLEDSDIAEIINQISRRIVREKGPVVMDVSGFTEKGFKRKLAVQALFAKILYLSELQEFCTRDSSLVIKDIFGVTDEDAESLRIHSLSQVDDVESITKMTYDSDSEPETETETEENEDNSHTNS